MEWEPYSRHSLFEEAFAAAQRAMARLGPRELSLAAIAAEAGVTAGVLVQRFGSKRELLLAVVERWAEGTREMLERLRIRHGSPLAALGSYAECVAAMGQSPDALAHHLSYLQMDLTDPDFQRHMRRNAEVTRATLAGWLPEAVAVGDLEEGTDVPTLARPVEATVGGIAPELGRPPGGLGRTPAARKDTRGPAGPVASVDDRRPRTVPRAPIVSVSVTPLAWR